MESIKYLKSLIKRIEDSEKKIKQAEYSGQITEQERLIQPVLKEIQMVCPRIWDDYIKVTRTRRQEISEGK